MISRNEILHFAYNIVENPPEDVNPTSLSSSKLASLIFLYQLRQAGVAAYIARFEEFHKLLDMNSQMLLHVSMVNGMYEPIDYDYVVTLVTLLIESWNKSHAKSVAASNDDA